MAFIHQNMEEIILLFKGTRYAQISYGRRDSFYMKQALAEAARAAEEREVPVGAVVVCRDRILARA